MFFATLARGALRSPASGAIVRRPFNPLRAMSESAERIELAYATPLKWMHWIYGAGFLTCLGTVLASQQTTGDTFLGTKNQTKGKLMMIHKSTAVVLAALVTPRVLLRLATAAPKALPGSFMEHFAANLSHVSLYGFMLAMPATGMAMGYYGGNGIPFYGLYTIPGIPKDKRTKEDGAFAGQLFKWHKWLGSFIWYLVPLHVAGAAQHMLRGHAIWGRIVPGIKPA